MNGLDSSASRLATAQHRLARAIDRLEGAAAGAAQGAGPGGDQDADQLADQLKALRDENTQLRGAVEASVARLDGTIAKFKDKLAG